MDLSPRKISDKLAISSKLSKSIEKKLIDEGLLRKIYFRKGKVNLDDNKIEERWMKINQYRKENKTLGEIALLMNLSKPTIANTIRAMKDAGWSVPNSRNDEIYKNVRLSSEEFERRKAFIIDGTLKGKSRKQIGKELGLDQTAISRFISKYLTEYL